MSETEKTFGARVVIQLKDEFARSVHDSGISHAPETALDPLKERLAAHNAVLAGIMDDFLYHVQSSDAHGAPANPMLAWTRDATQSPRAQAYYHPKFVVMVGAGIKVFDSEVAERIAANLREIEGQGVVEMVRVDSMDPSKNPPIPRQYFESLEPPVQGQ